jgi:hypothetical protein
MRREPRHANSDAEEQHLYSQDHDGAKQHHGETIASPRAMRL